MTRFNLTSEQIDDLYNKAEEIRGNISLIKMFCERYYNVDDFFKIKALIKNTDNLSSILYVDLTNLKADKIRHSQKTAPY